MHATMTWIDWMMVGIPLIVVIIIGLKAQQYVNNVSDFLAAGRVAGRYLLSVADGTAGMGLISVVALFEYNYKSGYALDFWGQFGAIVTLFLTLTGFVIYRYRETRAMTMAQFFEMRYSRGFRILAGFLAFLSGLLNYALFPAVGGRFLMYYCQLPDYVQFFGMNWSVFGLLMAGFLSFALIIVLLGGQLTTMVTDCVQGLFSYVIYAIVVITILYFFSISDIKEAVMDRPDGMSFFNPFNVGKLTSFNILYVMIGLFGAVYGRNAWLGNQGYYCSAANPHEQKMAGVLGMWRGGFTTLMVMLLVIGAYTFMHHPKYKEKADAVQTELVDRINFDSQATTETIRNQMLVPVALRSILPIGITGLFMALMLFLLISTDTTYMHSWGTILVQDVILPIRSVIVGDDAPISPTAQIWILRGGIFFIAAFAWTFSYFFGQVDYILMFFTMTGSIFLGGAGACIIGGLYWKRGTVYGAYAAMILSCVLGCGCFLLQTYWEEPIYPFLFENAPGMLEGLRSSLETIGNVLPIVSWETSADKFAMKFPITSTEMYFLMILICLGSYIILSLLTCKRPFNLDKMLHRGKYNLEHFVAKNADQEVVEAEKEKIFEWKSLLGITSEYTRGDRILAWSVLLWTGWGFLLFLFQLVCNTTFWQWGEEGWFNWWCYYTLPMNLVVGVVTTVWFSWGSSRDLYRLFRKLKEMKLAREANPSINNDLDDGTVREHQDITD